MQILNKNETILQKYTKETFTDCPYNCTQTSLIRELNRFYCIFPIQWNMLKLLYVVIAHLQNMH